jgi:HEPN domain-containing protein
LYIPPNRILYYEQNNESDASKYQLLSPKAKKKFAKSIEDAEEAAKCIALGRYTASVFHLMRVMERGVQRLGRKLKITIPVEEKDWGAISSHINGALKRLPNSTPPEKRIHSRYAKAAVYVDNVRESWRNPTMHPKETYTEEEAENAFRFVKQFMEYLAAIV